MTNISPKPNQGDLIFTITTFLKSFPDHLKIILPQAEIWLKWVTETSPIHD